MECWRRRQAVRLAAILQAKGITIFACIDRLTQILHFETNLMKNIILLTLVYMGFVVTTPFTSQALDSKKISPNLDSHSERLRQREPNMEIAQYNRDRYPNDQDPNDQDRDNQGRETQSCDRLFIVYYRSHDDRKWMYVSKHCNRRDARRAANRLERRGYRIQIL